MQTTIKEDGDTLIIPGVPTGSDDIAQKDIPLIHGTFKGYPVFNVSTDSFKKTMFGKKKYHKWSAYLGNDPVLDEIRKWQCQSKNNMFSNFIIRNDMTGEMVMAREK